MTAHDCTTFDPRCYRCDLSRDEVRTSPYVTPETGASAPCEEPNHYVLEDGECLDCRALPCMAKGRAETSDGPVRDVDCDLQHGHADRHWDESEFTFWEAS